MRHPSATLIPSATSVLFLCLFAITPGCNCKDPNVTYVDPLVNRYFNYQPGSWWVYSDSLTGHMDSFVVVSNGTIRTALNGHQYDDVTMRLKAFAIGYTDDISLDIGLHANSISYILYESTYHVVPVNFYYPYTDPGTVTYSGNTQTFITSSAHSTINNQAYDDVAHTTTYDNGTYVASFDINTAAGIIKLATAHGSRRTILELQRYHIVR